MQKKQKRRKSQQAVVENFLKDKKKFRGRRPESGVRVWLATRVWRAGLVFDLNADVNFQVVN